MSYKDLYLVVKKQGVYYNAAEPDKEFPRQWATAHKENEARRIRDGLKLKGYKSAYLERA